MLGLVRPGALALRMVAHSMQAAAVVGFSMFLPLIREDISMTTAQAGLLGTVATLSNAAMHLPAGMLVARTAATRTVFSAALLATNLGTVSLFFLDSYFQLVVLQALLGPVRALVFHSGMQLVQGHFAPNRQATAMSTFVMAAMSSNLMLGVGGAPLAALIGWRGVFLTVGLLGAALTISQWVVDRSAPRPAVVDSPVRLGGLGTLLRLPVVRACLVLHATRVGIGSAMMFWLPTVLVSAKGLSLEQMGLVIGACSLLAAPGNIAGGLLADRTGRPGVVIAAASSVGVLAVSGLALADEVGLVVALALLHAASVEVGFGPTFAVAARAAGPGLAGLVGGIGAQCAVLGGATLTYLVGATAEVREPFVVSLLLVAGVGLIGLVTAVRLDVALARSAAPRWRNGDVTAASHPYETVEQQHPTSTDPGERWSNVPRRRRRPRVAASTSSADETPSEPPS